jgi:hypothetical protein
MSYVPNRFQLGYAPTAPADALVLGYFKVPTPNPAQHLRIVTDEAFGAPNNVSGVQVGLGSSAAFGFNTLGNGNFEGPMPPSWSQYGTISNICRNGNFFEQTVQWQTGISNGAMLKQGGLGYYSHQMLPEWWIQIPGHGAGIAHSYGDGGSDIMTGTTGAPILSNTLQSYRQSNGSWTDGFFDGAAPSIAVPGANNRIVFSGPLYSNPNDSNFGTPLAQFFLSYGSPYGATLYTDNATNCLMRQIIPFNGQWQTTLTLMAMQLFGKSRLNIALILQDEYSFDDFTVRDSTEIFVMPTYEWQQYTLPYQPAVSGAYLQVQISAVCTDATDGYMSQVVVDDVTVSAPGAPMNLLVNGSFDWWLMLMDNTGSGWEYADCNAGGWCAGYHGPPPTVQPIYPSGIGPAVTNGRYNFAGNHVDNTIVPMGSLATIANPFSPAGPDFIHVKGATTAQGPTQLTQVISNYQPGQELTFAFNAYPYDEDVMGGAHESQTYVTVTLTQFTGPATYTPAEDLVVGRWYLNGGEITPPFGTWTRYTGTWTPPGGSGATNILINFSIRLQDDVTVGGVMCLDDVQLNMVPNLPSPVIEDWTFGYGNFEGSVAGIQSAAGDGGHMLIPSFDVTNVSYTNDFLLTSAPVSGGPGQYQAIVDLYTRFPAGNPAGWASGATDTFGNPFTPMCEIVFTVTGSGASGAITPPLVNVELGPMTSAVQAAADPRYPGYYWYRNAITFTAPSGTEMMGAQLYFQFTSGWGIGGVTILQETEAAIAATAALQSALLVDDIQIDFTENWYPCVRDGVFQQPYTLNSAEPSGSWLYNYFQNGDELVLVYSVPEFVYQNPLAYGYQGGLEVDEPAQVLSTQTILVHRHPILDFISYTVNGTVYTNPVSGDLYHGVVTIPTTLAPTDDVRVTYVYRQDRYVYRGWYDGSVFHDLDLNPGAGHRYEIGADGVGQPGYTLLDRGIVLYAIPTAAYPASGLSAGGASGSVNAMQLPDGQRPSHFVRHQIGTSTTSGPLAPGTSAIMLAELFVDPPGTVNDVTIMDVRSRGGGLPVGWNPTPSQASFTESVRVMVDPTIVDWLNTGIDLQVGDQVVFSIVGISVPSSGGCLAAAVATGSPAVAYAGSLASSTGIGAFDDGEGFTAAASGRLFVMYNYVIDPESEAIWPNLFLKISVTRLYYEGVNWDIDSWDGQPVMLNGVAVVEVPSAVLTGADGFRAVTAEQVAAAVQRHVAAGIYPIIRYV